ncbi:DNA polymerase IV [bacterium BMS3Bbin03]|nr:DNA polymerase IV [bacterium BMS3Bbin03]
MTPIILHIDVDAFFASAEQSFNPLLRGKPVIVGGFPDQRGVVHSASYEAREKGVRTGMPLSAAQRLCPEAVFLKGEFHHYKYIAEQLFKIYTTFTPQVEFTSLDDAYLNATGTLRLWGTPVDLAREIQETVRQKLHIPVSIGIGRNKLISRMASAQHKPRGITCVPSGHEPEFLHPLPVSQLPGVGRVTQRLFYDLGITTIGELARFPGDLLYPLLGKNGQKIRDYANGLDGRPVRPVRIPKQLSRETSFEEDVSDPSVVLAALHYLIERLAKKLREDHLVCRKMGLKIRSSDFQSMYKTGTLPEAVQDAFRLGVFAEQIFNSLKLRRTRTRFVQVQVSALEPEAWQQQLFQWNQKRQTLNQSIDRIRRRFGFMAILPANTLLLQSNYRMDSHGYILHTPSLSQ